MKVITESVERIDHVATGKLVRDLRETKGISLRRLAIALKVSPPFLSDMERGRRNWTTERFEQAIKWLKMKGN
jgi:transcriptional regulator with XRE-family HTH domain